MTEQRTRPWRAMRSRWGPIAVACGFALLLSVGLVARGVRSRPNEPSSASGQASQDQTSAPPRVFLEFAVAAHARAGATDAAKATMPRVLALGERVQVAFDVGTSDRPEFCAIGTLNDGEASSGFVTWTAEATVSQVEGERIDLELTWHRQMAGGAPSTDGSQLVRLRDGQTHLLDMVAAAPDNPTRCSFVGLQVTATLRPPQAMSCWRIGSGWCSTATASVWSPVRWRCWDHRVSPYRSACAP